MWRSSHQVATAYPVLEAFGQRFKSNVALLTAKGVVHAFEAVDVHMQHGAVAAVAARAIQNRRGQLRKECPVGQTRDLVVVGQLHDAILRFNAVGDVLSDAFDEHTGVLHRTFSGRSFSLLEQHPHAGIGARDSILQLIGGAFAQQIQPCAQQ